MGMYHLYHVEMYFTRGAAMGKPDEYAWLLNNPFGRLRACTESFEVTGVKNYVRERQQQSQ